MRNVRSRVLNVERFTVAAPLVVLAASLVPGCGSKDEVGANGAAPVPTATKRVLENPRFQDPRFKAMLEKKGGAVNWSPEMAKMAPPGTPTK